MFGVIRINTYKFDFCGIAVEKHTITFQDFFAGRGVHLSANRRVTSRTTGWIVLVQHDRRTLGCVVFLKFSIAVLVTMLGPRCLSSSPLKQH
jgi:hypothetical protein